MRKSGNGGGQVVTREPAYSNPLRALWRLAAITLVILFYYLHYHLTRHWIPKGADTFLRSLRYTHSWARKVCRIMGIRTKVSGELPEAGSMLTPNHLGYADILAIAAAIPTFFVAKSEIAGWPGIGYIFRKTEHIIVHREDAKELPGTIREMGRRLQAGHNVCVFLEGTSTGGDAVLPFLPSLTQAAISTCSPLAPMAVRWRPRNRRIDVSEDIAYWKDHVFASHAWRLLGLKGLEVEIRFGKALPTRERKRRELAEAARSEVMRLCGFAEG
jgi:1-acyl-sn-glycerol-3-phosphate acyltransferase